MVYHMQKREMCEKRKEIKKQKSIDKSILML